MAQDPRLLLLGAWRIVDRREAGKDTRDPEDDYKFLWFTDNEIVSGDRWSAWNMPYKCFGKPDYGVLEIVRLDLRDTYIANAKFTIVDSQLHLCVGVNSTDIPTRFDSTAENGHVYYRAERCEEPLPA